MSLGWVLLGAQLGGSLLSAKSASRAAAKEAAQGTFQARYQGLMERYQIQHAAELDALQRREQYAQAVGSQRAALGFAGVSGGRTAQLLSARDRVEYERAQEYADTSTRLAMSSSEFQEQQNISGFRRVAKRKQEQASLDLFGDVLSLGQKGYELYQAGKAAKK